MSKRKRWIAKRPDVPMLVHSGTWGVLPSMRRDGRYQARLFDAFTRRVHSTRHSLRRADGVPPISCVIFATHSSNAGATSFNSVSRGA